MRQHPLWLPHAEVVFHYRQEVEPHWIYTLLRCGRGGWWDTGLTARQLHERALALILIAPPHLLNLHPEKMNHTNCKKNKHPLKHEAVTTASAMNNYLKMPGCKHAC